MGSFVDVDIYGRKPDSTKGMPAEEQARFYALRKLEDVVGLSTPAKDALLSVTFKSSSCIKLPNLNLDMVGIIDPCAHHNDIRVTIPQDDAGHNAHFIKTASVEINGRQTDFIVQPFSDRIFVIVTQMQKIGTMISTEREVTVGGAESFVVKVLLGKRDIPEMELCARTLMSKMAKDGCTRSLLISLALKDHSMQTITGVIKKIQELRVW